LTGPRRFCFLNRQLELTDPDAWRRITDDRLWLYNLHYFDDLVARDSASRRTWHDHLISEWIEQNPPASAPGWEPYPTSVRIVNLVKWALAGNLLPNAALHSLAIQARHLLARLEYHLLGNHLLANAKALVFVGSFFEGPESARWLSKGLSIVASQLAEQILPDGGHFELSPMYHCLILEDLLDLYNLAQTFSPCTPPAIVETIHRTSHQMRRWLAAMCHPDGDISLFNDAAFGVAPTPTELDEYARRLAMGPIPAPEDGLTCLIDSGYVRVQWDDAVAILDVGRIGPDYLPGHAHADTLTFELSLHGHRAVVDTGTFCYRESEQRSWDRSTAAHNTVLINGADSSEVWSSHRVARRAYPEDFTTQQSRAGEIVVACAHDGYRRLTGRPTHRRIWRCAKNSLEITDQVMGHPNTVTAHLYFHPDLPVTRANDTTFVARVADTIVEVTVQGAQATLDSATYHPEFGREDRCQRITSQFTGSTAIHRVVWS
jgi:uncharacterized heparinase superfamily protein